MLTDGRIIWTARVRRVRITSERVSTRTRLNSKRKGNHKYILRDLKNYMKRKEAPTDCLPFAQSPTGVQSSATRLPRFRCVLFFQGRPSPRKRFRNNDVAVCIHVHYIVAEELVDEIWSRRRGGDEGREKEKERRGQKCGEFHYCPLGMMIPFGSEVNCDKGLVSRRIVL